jgi:hypothetical protein
MGASCFRVHLGVESIDKEELKMKNGKNVCIM